MATYLPNKSLLLNPGALCGGILGRDGSERGVTSLAPMHASLTSSKTRAIVPRDPRHATAIVQAGLARNGVEQSMATNIENLQLDSTTTPIKLKQVNVLQLAKKRSRSDFIHGAGTVRSIKQKRITEQDVAYGPNSDRKIQNDKKAPKRKRVPKHEYGRGTSNRAKERNDRIIKQLKERAKEQATRTARCTVAHGSYSMTGSGPEHRKEKKSKPDPKKSQHRKKKQSPWRIPKKPTSKMSAPSSFPKSAHDRVREALSQNGGFAIART